MAIKLVNMSYAGVALGRSVVSLLVDVCFLFIYFCDYIRSVRAAIDSDARCSYISEPVCTLYSKLTCSYRNLGVCKVTVRRHRVSPCRSAYFASPWRILTLNLRRGSREAALLFPESSWHLRRGLSPVSFYGNPEYKTPS